jgi:hypothetical protein
MRSGLTGSRAFMSKAVPPPINALRKRSIGKPASADRKVIIMIIAEMAASFTPRPRAKKPETVTAPCLGIDHRAPAPLVCRPKCALPLRIPGHLRAASEGRGQPRGYVRYKYSNLVSAPPFPPCYPREGIKTLCHFRPYQPTSLARTPPRANFLEPPQGEVPRAFIFHALG